MQVLLVTGEYPPDPGGVGSYTAQLAHHLAGAGLNISVVAVNTPLDVPLEPESRFKLLRLHKPWGRSANKCVRMLADLDAETWVHVQYQTGAFNMNPGINLAARGWRRSNLRVAWTYHDLLPPYLLPKIGQRVRDWATLHPAKFAESVISTNPADCAQLHAAGFPAQEIPVPSLLPVNHSDPEALATVRESFGVQPDELLLGHMGLALPGKGIQTLVESLRVLRRGGESARLLLIGGSSGQGDQANSAFREGLLRQIESSGMQDHVIWTGHLDNEKTSAAIACCDLMVMPFTAGASARSSSLMACLAQGSVTITTKPQETGLLPAGLPIVPPLDHVELADAIQEICHDPERQAQARQAAATVTKDRSWEQVTRLHRLIYESSKQRP